MVSYHDNYLIMDRILLNLSSKLDISPTLYKLAVDHYNAVGNWLEDTDISEIFDGSSDTVPTGKIESNIYPQGSFALGTVVKPWSGGKEREYDIDLVFHFDLPVGTKRAYSLKKAVGNRLLANSTYANMLKEEGKRCWTLLYAEQSGATFHLDILPALNSVSSSSCNNEINITNKKGNNNYDWQFSNPLGYQKWFKSRNSIAFRRIENYERNHIFESNAQIFATVHSVPDYLIRTPLQRAIQLLKRHRDIYFSKNDCEIVKPISIIITTLSAKIYNNEESVIETITNITNTLLLYKKLLNNTPKKILNGLINYTSEGKWYIPNPVCNNENFADKWHLENNKRAKAFFQWLDELDNDLSRLASDFNSENITALTSKKFGIPVSLDTYEDGNRAFNSLTIPTTTNAKLIIDNPPKPWLYKV